MVLLSTGLNGSMRLPPCEPRIASALTTPGSPNVFKPLETIGQRLNSRLRFTGGPANRLNSAIKSLHVLGAHIDAARKPAERRVGFGNISHELLNALTACKDSAQPQESRPICRRPHLRRSLRFRFLCRQLPQSLWFSLMILDFFLAFDKFRGVERESYNARRQLCCHVLNPYCAVPGIFINFASAISLPARAPSA